MSELVSPYSERPGPVQAGLIRNSIQQIQRRQWQLWSSAVLVTLLLALGIASFAFPGILAQAGESPWIYFDQAVRGLVGLVLIFNVYSVYQQLQLHRIQRQLTDQVEALGKMEARTEEVYQLAIIDPLTNLYNRRCGEQRLTEEITRSHRHSTPLTVLLLDINNLKRVNDTLGHPAGDELIKHFAHRLQRAIRGSDVAVRLGGDEFLVLLPECKLNEVHNVLDRLSGMKIELGKQTIPITFASGWTDYVPGELPEDLLKRADAALYVDKRSGKKEGNLKVAIT
jgi:diguanylate cyclase (GGDEF)-like protein